MAWRDQVALPPLPAAHQRTRAARARISLVISTPGPYACIPLPVLGFRCCFFFGSGFALLLFIVRLPILQRNAASRALAALHCAWHAQTTYRTFCRAGGTPRFSINYLSSRACQHDGRCIALWTRGSLPSVTYFNLLDCAPPTCHRHLPYSRFANRLAAPCRCAPPFTAVLRYPRLPGYHLYSHLRGRWWGGLPDGWIRTFPGGGGWRGVRLDGASGGHRLPPFVPHGQFLRRVRVVYYLDYTSSHPHAPPPTPQHHTYHTHRAARCCRPAPTAARTPAHTYLPP